MLHKAATISGCQCRPQYACRKLLRLCNPSCNLGLAALVQCLNIHGYGAGVHQVVLLDQVPEEWRLLVSLCRAPIPADRPTVPQLQLYLLDLCQRSKKALIPSRSMPANAISHAAPRTLSQAQSPSAACQKATASSMEHASEVPSQMPKMMSNPIYSPGGASVSPPQGPADHKESSWQSPLAALASRIPWPATSQRGVGTPAAGRGVGLLVPRLMPAVEQWLPHETVTLIGGSPDSSGSSPLAAATPSKQSTAAPALVTNEELAVSGSLLSSHNTSSRTGSGEASGAAVPSIFGGSHSEEHDAALAGSPLSNLPDSCGKKDDVISSRQAASDYPSSEMLYQAVPSTRPLMELQDNGEHDDWHIRATDVGHLVHMNGAVRRSPVSRLAPRRDDSALEQGPMAKWIALTQNKAAAVAGAFNRRASGMVEQTTGMLQLKSEAQLSTETVSVNEQIMSVTSGGN